MNRVELTIFLLAHKWLVSQLSMNTSQLTIYNITEACGMPAIILSAIIISMRLKEAILLLYQQQDFGKMCLYMPENQTLLSP